ncbi:MAG: hypothetical protein KGI48_11245 [Hyphomicrobiales bacterium]|nr:hypothetical protein [Hyphomicrobiales bacterium]
MSTGAADDLRRITDIARSMVARYGMSVKLGSVAYDRDPRNFLTGPNLPLPMPQREEEYAEETAAAIDKEVRDIVQVAMDRTLNILHDKRDTLERSAHKLLEKETLDEQDLIELIGRRPDRCGSPPNSLRSRNGWPRADPFSPARRRTRLFVAHDRFRKSRASAFPDGAVLIAGFLIGSRS